MKKFIYLTFIGLLGLLYSCEKDGDQVFILDNPAAPEIISMPDLTLERNNGADTLEFIISDVDPGFVASAKYFLEACATGDNFANAISLASQDLGESFRMSVADLNTILLSDFPADEASSVDFRVRARLVVDAGTGAPGTSDDSFEYISETQTASVTLYGLPKLSLIDSGTEQSIESPLGNGEYSGMVKLDASLPFTLYDPDNDISYGGSGGTLSVDGSGITVDESGWYQMEANTNDLSYSTSAYMIGLVGSATPNGWDTPDQKMDYDWDTGTWYITIDLIDGEIKFRLNDGWAWNLGGTTDNLTQGGDNIAVSAGNYTITLTINSDDTGSCTIVKN